MSGIAARIAVFAVFLLSFAAGQSGTSLAGPFQDLGLPLPAPGSISSYSGPGPATSSDMASMATAQDVAAPEGWLAFCSRHPDQCVDDSAQPTSVAWTPALQQQLEAVNLAFNTAIQPMEDSVHYGRFDYWAIPIDGYGDCEDYALAKRKALADAGLPRRALRMAIVRLPNGETHAVLTVVTSAGDYVLDNLTSAVLPWNSTKLVWIARQVPGQIDWGRIETAAQMARAETTATDMR